MKDPKELNGACPLTDRSSSFHKRHSLNLATEQPICGSSERRCSPLGTRRLDGTNPAQREGWIKVIVFCLRQQDSAVTVMQKSELIVPRSGLTTWKFPKKCEHDYPEGFWFWVCFKLCSKAYHPYGSWGKYSIPYPNTADPASAARLVMGRKIHVCYTAWLKASAAVWINFPLFSKFFFSKALGISKSCPRKQVHKGIEKHDIILIITTGGRHLVKIHS